MLNQDQANMVAALAAATATEREVTAARPDGRSKWHSYARLVAEQDLMLSETDAHRVAGALARKGILVSRTVLTVTRWTLTEDGARAAKGLARMAGAA